MLSQAGVFSMWAVSITRQLLRPKTLYSATEGENIYRHPYQLLVSGPRVDEASSLLVPGQRKENDHDLDRSEVSVMLEGTDCVNSTVTKTFGVRPIPEGKSY